MYKRSFGTRVYRIADKFNIEQTAVNRIINSYISVCRQELLSGMEIRILGLVSVIPNVLTSEYISTLALHCKKASQQTGYSYHTVYSVISEYLDSIELDLLDGNPVDIRTIVSLHPLRRDGELVKIHSLVSTSIKSDLENLDGVVSSVRVHTCKILKYELSKVSKSEEVFA